MTRLFGSPGTVQRARYRSLLALWCLLLAACGAPPTPTRTPNPDPPTPTRRAAASPRAGSAVTSSPELRLVLGVNRNENAVTAVAFHPSGKQVISASYDKSTGKYDKTLLQAVKVWRVSDGFWAKSDGHPSVMAVAYSPDGKTLATAGFDKVINLWDPDGSRDEPKRSWENSSPLGMITSLAFSPDSRLLAASAFDRAIVIWDVASGKEVRRWSAGEKVVHNVAFSPDGTTLASAGGDGTARLWNAATGAEIRRFAVGGLVSSVAFSPDGTVLAVGGSSEGGPATLWNPATGEQLRRLEGGVGRVTFGRNGQLIAGAGAGYTVKIWSTASGKLLRTLSGHTAAINALAFSSDGALLASGSGDKTTRLWDIAGIAP